MKQIISILLLMACLVLWCSQPFMAINMMTLDDQPAAADLFGEELAQYFDLSDTPPYWTALGVIICIAIALTAAFIDLTGVKQSAALLGEFPLIWGFHQMYLWTKGSDYLFDTVGIGFWGIAALLIIVALLGKDGIVKEE